MSQIEPGSPEALSHLSQKQLFSLHLGGTQGQQNSLCLAPVSLAGLCLHLPGALAGALTEQGQLSPSLADRAAALAKKTRTGAREGRRPGTAGKTYEKQEIREGKMREEPRASPTRRRPRAAPENPEASRRGASPLFPTLGFPKSRLGAPLLAPFLLLPEPSQAPGPTAHSLGSTDGSRHGAVP